MINRKYVSIILLIVFVVSAYLLLSNNSTFYSRNDASLIDDNTKNSNQFSGSFSIILKSGDNPSDYGLAVFAKSEDKTKVSIKMINSSSEVAQNAFIYKNTCKNLEEVKYELNEVVNGSLETTLDTTSQDFINNLPMVLVIKGADDNQIFSCADIVN